MIVAIFLVAFAASMAVTIAIRRRRRARTDICYEDQMRAQISRENRARIADPNRWVRRAGDDFEIHYHRRTTA